MGIYCVPVKKTSYNLPSYRSTNATKEERSNPDNLFYLNRPLFLSTVTDCFDLINFGRIHRRIVEGADILGKGIECKIKNNRLTLYWRKSRQAKSNERDNEKISLRAIILDQLSQWIRWHERSNFFSIEDLFVLYVQGEELQLYDHPSIMVMCKCLLTD